MKKYRFAAAIILLMLITQFISNADEAAPAENLREKREKIISFGLNSEVGQLIKDLAGEKDSSYNNSLINLFEKSNNTAILTDILELFTVTGSDSLLEPAAGKIKNREYENRNVIIASLKYLSSMGNSRYNDLFLEILDDNNPSYRIEAVKALCLTGEKKYSANLLELYENEKDVSVKQQILLDIGKLKAEESVSFLEEIASDRDQELTFRQYSLNSLGLIGAESSFSILLSAWNEDDPFIRMYALSSLSMYEKNDETFPVIMESMKDENWRIRKAAVSAAGDKKDNAFLDMLVYRAENDPVEEIRLEAVSSIAATGDSRAFDFIREKASDSRINPKIRRHSFKLAIENDLSASMEMIETLLQKEWNAANLSMLENFCSELSVIESGSLKPFFEKMLDHPSVVVKVSGLRGIKLNRISSLKERVRAIAEDKLQPLSVRNNAESALDTL